MEDRENLKIDNIIIGSGALGKSLSCVIGNNIVLPYGKFINQFFEKSTFETAKNIFLCIPGFCIPKFFEIFNSMPYDIRKNISIITCSKGLYKFDNTIHTAYSFACNATKNMDNIAVMTGANMSKEIENLLPTVAFFGCKNIELQKKIQNTINIKNSSFKISYCNEPSILQDIGVLKNIYSIILGFISIRYGKNYYAHVFGLCINESIKLLMSYHELNEIKSYLIISLSSDIFLSTLETRNFILGQKFANNDPLYHHDKLLEGYCSIGYASDYFNEKFQEKLQRNHNSKLIDIAQSIINGSFHDDMLNY